LFLLFSGGGGQPESQQGNKENEKGKKDRLIAGYYYKITKEAFANQTLRREKNRRQGLVKK